MECMTDKPETRKPDQKKLYLIAGICFLVAGVVFVFTQMSGLWISMFVLGIVFITLSATKPAAAKEDAPPE